MNGNNISHLTREEFTNLRLMNLQKVHMQHTNIRIVHREAFKDLKILIEIDLSNNLIEQLDKQTFSSNDRLRILDLSGNPIRELVAYQFPVLRYFRTLYMENCKLVHIHETAFSNLDQLEALNLKFNALTKLPENVFNHMKNLKTLSLEDNPWVCDCALRKFKAWYNARGGYPSLVCTEPALLKDRKWESIETEDFGCPPTIEILKDEFQVEDMGLNVTYRCVSHGDPLPTMQWDVNGKLLEADNENARIEEDRLGLEELWSNLTIFNLSSFDTGIYTCSAHNKFGFVNKNFSIILPETIFPVLTRTPETFWYFGLIVGVFGFIFALMFISISICICKKFANRRRRKKGNIKNSVSFNDQEKKLLDLSITTNDKQESSEMVNTPSTAKTDSIIALEPVQITIENIARNEEFPLNVGVFPPPPEFRTSNIVPTTPYGNIFISVSLTPGCDSLAGSASGGGAAGDNHDMYPDLLNIPKRIKGGATGSFVSYATLPRPIRNAAAETTLTESAIESYDDSSLSTTGGGVCLACRKEADTNSLTQVEQYYHPVCENVAITLNYDTVGRRVTAGGSLGLPLPQLHETQNEEPESAVVSVVPVEQPQQSFLNLNAKEISISTLPPPQQPAHHNDFVSL